MILTPYHLVVYLLVADPSSVAPPRFDGDLVSVEGVVTYRGPMLDPVPVPEASTMRHLVEVDPKTNGLRDAIVWLEGVAKLGDRPAAGREKPVQMDQLNYFFVPHVLAVRAGQEVEFVNSDSANHGVMATAFEPENSFNVVTPTSGSYKHRFRSSRRPIPIGCPIHSGMAAWIVVFDHGYFAVTDKLGKFRIPDVPPGRYALVIRHLDRGLHRRQDIEVQANGTGKIVIALTAADLKAGSEKKPTAL